MARIIINADGSVLGRLCSFAAKKAIEGNEIAIVNSEKVIITGNKKNLVNRYKNLRKVGGSALKGPNYPRESHKILKRAIRGMLSNFRSGQGKKALKRVKCYNGVPEELKNEKMIKSDIKKRKYIELKEISDRFN